MSPSRYYIIYTIYTIYIYYVYISIYIIVCAVRSTSCYSYRLRRRCPAHHLAGSDATPAARPGLRYSLTGVCMGGWRWLELAGKPRRATSMEPMLPAGPFPRPSPPHRRRRQQSFPVAVGPMVVETPAAIPLCSRRRREESNRRGAARLARR